LWPKKIGAEYLISRTGRKAERAFAAALSDALGGLPLAHEQTAAYCERLELPLSAYHKRFEDTPARMLDSKRDAPADYRLTVAKTFALAIDEAAKLHPAAEPLIIHAALLAPEPIPLFLFAEAREKFDEPLASALANDGVDESVGALRAYALVDRETIADERDPTNTTDCIRLHRLVRTVAAARCDGEARERVRRTLIEAVAAAYPTEVHDDPKKWLRARRLNGLASALVTPDAGPPAGVEAPFAELLNGFGEYNYVALGAYTQARQLFERALTIRKMAFGFEHSKTAESLNNLGSVLEALGAFGEARPLFERALAIREKVLGPENPETANSLNNLAHLRQALGNLSGAQPLFERALAIREKVLGSEHPYTATSLNNLARLLRAQGKPAEARRLFERALVIDEKMLGSEHPHTAIDLNNLALCLQDQGDLLGARPLFERALAINEKVLGTEHPRTNMVRSNIARLNLASGDPSGALAIVLRPGFETLG
jgi:tetratricopeptide (TPR) repeat protein